MNVIEAIENRRSIRKYKDTDISKDIIMDILNAGRLGPSAKNRQPWYFVKVSNGMKDNIVTLMKEYTKNKNKVGRLYSVDFTSDVIKEAPVLILILRDKDSEWDRFDYLSIGAATENMILRCVELNLGSLWIGDTDFASSDILKMIGHEDKELVCSLAIGIANQSPKMRPRKDISDIVEYYD